MPAPEVTKARKDNMYFTRIRPYVDGEWTTFEELYLGTDIERSLKRFRRDYPENDECELKIDIIEEDPDNPSEYFKMCMSCGCVN